MRPRMTYDELNLLPREGRFTELIGGVLYNHASPSSAHQSIVYNLVKEVGIRTEKFGRTMFAPFDVILSKSDVVQPDLLFMLKKNLRKLTSRGFEGAPDLAVEIVSSSDEKYDTVTKKAVYQAYGVPRLWLVYPEKQTIEILERVGAKLVVKAVYTVRQRFTVSLFPQVTFRCSRIFAGIQGSLLV